MQILRTIFWLLFCGEIQRAVASEWESLGLGCGGQILLVAGDPADSGGATAPGIIYLGSNVAGLWRSENGGDSWNYLTAGWTPKDCQSIAFDPADPNRIFIGTEEEVLQSDDRGASWKRVMSKGLGVVGEGKKACALATGTNSLGELVLYFSTGDVQRNQDGDGRIYRCIFQTDGTTALADYTYLRPLESTTKTVVTIRVDPLSTQNLWISTRLGVFRSTDAGASWTPFNNGLPSSLDCGKLVVDPGNFDNLYVVVKGSVGITGGLFHKPAEQSDWVAVPGLPSLTVVGENPIEWTSLVIDIRGPAGSFGEKMWVGSQTKGYGVYGTMTGFAAMPGWVPRQTITEQGWAAGNPLGTNPDSLTQLANGHLWCGKSGNFHRSVDAGETWQQRYTTQVGPPIPSTAPAANEGRRTENNWTQRGMVNTVDNQVAVDPSHPQRILIALADRAVFGSTDGGKSFHQYRFKFSGSVSGNSGFYAGFHPLTGDAYVSLKDAFGIDRGQETSGIYRGIYQSETEGWHWSLFAGGSDGLGELPADALPTELIFHPQDSQVMWSLAQGFSNTSPVKGIWETRNGGASWAQIGLTSRNVRCLAVDPANPDVLLVGVAAGSGGIGIYRGVRAGGNWSFPALPTFSVQLPGAARPEDCLNLSFDAGPASAGLVYAAMGRAGIYRSTDSGLNWSLLSQFGPTGLGVGVRSLTAGGTAEHCYAAKSGSFETPARVSRTADGGTAWLPISPPCADCNSLVVSGPAADRQLYATTRGLGVWRLPLNYNGWKRQNFTPLEQEAPLISGSTADPDHDGKNNLLEYGTRSNPLLADDPAPFRASLIDGNLAATYPINPAAADVTFVAEASSSLPFTPPLLDVSQQITRDSYRLLEYTATAAGDLPNATRFMRLKLTLEP